MREEIKAFLGWYAHGYLTDEDALRALKLTNIDDLLTIVDEAGYDRPERHQPAKVKSDIDKAVEEAWLEVMTPPQLGGGNPQQVGPHNGAELFVAHVPGFLQQAKLSLAHWLTDQNLDWWLAAAQGQTYSKNPNPGFFRLLEIESELMEIARNIHDEKHAPTE